MGAVQAQSPAQLLFDEAAYFLALNYGGFAEPGPRELLLDFRAALAEACADDAACSTETAVEVIEKLLQALGDPHTSLYPPAAFEELQRFLGGEGEAPSFGLFTRELGNEGLVVLEVLEDSPAARAGMRRGDLLVALNGLSLSEEGAPLARLWELEAQGEPTTLGVVREGRERFEVALVSAALPRLRLPELEWLEGGAARLRIPSFVPPLAVGARIHETVAEAQAAKATGLLIDLRDNPGGFIADCLVGAEAFVDAPTRLVRSGLLSQTLRAEGGRLLSRSGESREFVQTVSDAPARFAGPVVVLVNAFSASCAEFFALDLQASGAPVVGEATGGVANTLTGFWRLSEGWGLQITTAAAFSQDAQPYPERVTPDLWQDDDLRALSRGEDLLLAAGRAALTRLTAARD